MKLSNFISKDFVVLPAQWPGNKAREVIFDYPAITHAILAHEPETTLRPFHATEMWSDENILGNLLLKIPRTSIDVVGRPWDRLRVSPAGLLYVVSREELADLEEEESNQTLSHLIRSREWLQAPLIPATTNPKVAPGLGVVFEKVRLAGILDVRMPSRGIHVPGLRFEKGDVISIGGTTGGGEPPDTPPPGNGGGKGPSTGDFNAFPRLEAPDRLAPGEQFTAVVGFRPDPDASLAESQPIHILNPPADAAITVLFTAIGATLLGERQHRLPLVMDAQAEILCAVEQAVTEVTLLVDYVYNSQLIGFAKRKLAVIIPGTTSPVIQDPGGDPASLSTPNALLDVDLTVSITNIDDKELQWEFFGAALPPKGIQKRKRIKNTRDFAAEIISELNLYQSGVFGERTLDNISGRISAAIPEEFFAALRKVHAAVKRRPTILIHTDEMYVPWELAAIDPPLSADYKCPFLGAQAVIGRWLRDEKVPVPPPNDVPLTKVCVVASRYGFGSDQPELPEAIEEQENLKIHLPRYGIRASTLEAKRPELEQLFAEEVTPGTGIHFAVHGYNDPKGNAQQLTLTDGQPLLPSTLAGRRKKGEPARFEFVFINACQIGTAGESLGQAAGFPGDLIVAGAKAFLAPLWNVHDETARLIAEAFYQQTLQDGISVAEFLSDRRATSDPKQTTTPLAYIFYGHPSLKVRAETNK